MRDLLLWAKHLFGAAIDGWGSLGPAANRPNQNMTAGPVAFGAGAVLNSFSWRGSGPAGRAFPTGPHY